MSALDRVERVGVKERFAALFPGEAIVFVADADAMAGRFDRLRDQRPSTCGAFALSYLLPALGFERHNGFDLSAEDYLAHLASVVVEEREVAPSEAVTRRFLGGELSLREALERYGDVWYRYPVRASADPTAQGTSPAGIARAVAIATDGQLCSLPVPGRRADGSVLLDEARWTALFDVLHANLTAWNVHAIFNYESDQLLDPRSDQYTPHNLRTADPLRLPRDHWGVGHFVGLAGLWHRPDGTRWLLLLDTYKERGFEGYQPQPAELMRRGLVREDGREGGVLLVVPRESLDALTQAVSALDIEPRTWDNGSPDPDGWQWKLGR